MTTQIMAKNCPGGHVCHPPKECCRQGCCYSPDYILKTTISPTTGNVFSPIFLGHWYFWAAITATLAGILCACSLWKRHNSNNLFCCRDSARDERASEPDSNGSCYNPPQYSRCNSFYQAPPPYSEVTSKPDLYPLVISYNGDAGLKNNGTPTGYLMVQYIRNFLVRPVGSISATSTIDSLSSSFICNATNEANTIIPPPYSCMGSLEEINVTINNPIAVTQLPVSITCNELRLPKNSSSIHSQISTTNFQSCHPPATTTNTNSQSTQHSQFQELPKKQASCSIQNAPAAVKKSADVCHKGTTYESKSPTLVTNQKSGDVICDGFHANTQVHIVNKKLNILAKDRSVDSESQEDEHNFSDLLNLSVCLPSSVIHLANGMQSHAIQDLQQSYSVTNSMTSSDISSLANLGTPDSPPRATSPTVEMRELLDKIQQLPQQKSPLPDVYHHSTQQQHTKVKSYFNKAKAKNLYMPLQNGSNVSQSKISPKASSAVTGIFGKNSRSWLSRSAPNTPCSNFIPSFSIQKRTTGSQRSSKVKLNDGSPLLHNHEESDEDLHKDECL